MSRVATWWEARTPSQQRAMRDGLIVAGLIFNATLVVFWFPRLYLWIDATAWWRIDLGTYKGALQGASELADGSVMLTGADGMIATSKDGGVTFAANPLPSRVTVTAVARTANGQWLAAGPSGLRPVK